MHIYIYMYVCVCVCVCALRCVYEHACVPLSVCLLSCTCALTNVPSPSSKLQTYKLRAEDHADVVAKQDIPASRPHTSSGRVPKKEPPHLQVTASERCCIRWLPSTLSQVVFIPWFCPSCFPCFYHLFDSGVLLLPCQPLLFTYSCLFIWTAHISNSSSKSIITLWACAYRAMSLAGHWRSFSRASISILTEEAGKPHPWA